ncbi:hypothetical protein [Nitrococcus mobilis]|uniref:Uncharacterized protein n=1 Tax=Nitrococcus mobilis Nb-231 TaxID=314278 RepID=A4BNV5_9GAMM|nr:hypothetical protein [Nitrococcus mobilis]EAR22904.1 hypothetical protein NB231_10638 [Nitrococcus mobilis Nb-231]
MLNQNEFGWLGGCACGTHGGHRSWRRATKRFGCLAHRLRDLKEAVVERCVLHDGLPIGWDHL